MLQHDDIDNNDVCYNTDTDNDDVCYNMMDMIVMTCVTI